MATFSLAHVVVLPARYSYALSEAFGKTRSVFHGAVRAYKGGFDASSDPYEHPLFLGESVSTSPAVSEAKLRWIVASESLRRTRLGDDILPFSEIRSAKSRIDAQHHIWKRTLSRATGSGESSYREP